MVLLELCSADLFCRACMCARVFFCSLREAAENNSCKWNWERGPSIAWLVHSRWNERPVLGSIPGIDPGASCRGFIPCFRVHPLTHGATKGLRRARRLQSLVGPVDLKKDAVFKSLCSCRSSCACVVWVWCVWIAWVCVRACTRYYSCTQMRGFKMELGAVLPTIWTIELSVL
jgi:hypothetical protein